MPTREEELLAPDFIYFAWHHANDFERFNEKKTERK